MRLGISGFITDILSTSSNICFCWAEGKVHCSAGGRRLAFSARYCTLDVHFKDKHVPSRDQYGSELFPSSYSRENNYWTSEPQYMYLAELRRTSVRSLTPLWQSTA
ncbi:tight junction ZO-2-like isoform X7 [Labeo rohita]|uniref:Tight junction ZO-2-like isoform X7 n=1 Tax=Labeo rohita TaxID=84645 RepID=A0A498P1L8_LABRO|nr:tight junction ZO-2-like isoform X7 [Labeo rohita]